MSIFHAIILGIVEGVTEFLPISSTAHLVIASRILGILQTDFVKTFEISIQLGAIAAVAVLYMKKIIANPCIIGKIIAGFIPTAIIGFVLYSAIKNVLLGNLTIIGWSLGLGGVALIVFEWWYQKRNKLSNIENSNVFKGEVSYGAAIWMGVCQSLAVIPGVSRSAATIVGGMIAGISRYAVVEFSFLLAAPTMFAATAFDIYKNPQVLTGENIEALVVGLLVSLGVAYVSMKWLLRYIQSHSFSGFGWYRIIIGVLILSLLAL